MDSGGKIWIERSYENCSGCRRCEIVCSLHHEGRIWPEASRVRIFMFIPGVEIPHFCFQCEDYPCVSACPSKALSVNSRTGAVNVDVSKCSACGLCISVCPGSVPHMHPEKNHIVICDLCDGNPKCVEACQEGKWNALKIVSRVEDVSYKSFACSPQILTIEVAKKLLGEETTKEALG
ncbi:MAG: 4Fe-4S dicluster domain-containing protein [Candidatus Bathyarchaeia archaeon]